MSEGKSRSVTIYDVAKLSGVSHQTVSRVVNGLPGVRAVTRQRVETAMRQLRYRPSPAARALVTRRTMTVGAIVGGAPDYGPASTLLAFNEAARTSGYAVSIAELVELDRAAVRAAVELMLRQNVDGIVLIAERVSAVEALERVELDVPLLAVDPRPGRSLPSVAIDQYAGARIAVEHLIELGHRSILHLAGPADSMDAGERLRAWRDVLADNHLPARPPIGGDWSPASGYQAGMGLQLEPAFTAVFASNDQMALGLIHALSSRGLRIPNDVSIVGFDDQPEAEHFTPPLTTVRQDFIALGREIMRALLALMGGADPVETAKTIPELRVRSSTGRPGADHRASRRVRQKP